MKRLTLIAILAATVALGCHHYHLGAHITRTDVPVSPRLSGWCSSLNCNVAVYIDSNCQLKDSAGNVITSIDVLVWTRVCFFNQSGCEVVLRFDPELFGSSRSTVTVGADECANLRVNQEARGKNYIFNIICQCVEGEGHTSPEVKVGDDEEGGG